MRNAAFSKRAFNDMLTSFTGLKFKMYVSCLAYTHFKSFCNRTTCLSFLIMMPHLN
ncbi:hypothetical protein SAMN05661012_05421 [Chitinophaga sancti]|uniref:Uncharacterized protein n=1 Tax=Chitinophaga sancti TaxID=1004 RepID=A0A1K1SGK9_9BACT|nr:hypothetical protein SAMN05661012_05421 [Chitinophaga sancti]